MPKETIRQTIGVAAGVCVVCSVLVSTASVCLKERQDANKRLEKRMNIVMAAGLYKSDGAPDVDELFQQIDARVVDLDDHDLDPEEIDPEEIDPRKGAQDPQERVEVRDKKLGMKYVGRYQLIYVREEGGRIERVVLPVVGKGLWSTMYGFLALDSDMTTIRSMAFYEHGETPGLGGEVDNEDWKRKWDGKQAFDQKGAPAIRVVKGEAAPGAVHEVDGLSGATLTSRGVENLVRFWLGEEGYGPVLQKLKAGGGDG